MTESVALGGGNPRLRTRQGETLPTGAPLARKSSGYRPDIDGLRAVAILPVVFYHVGVRSFSGGFVGVDIFFVISGFLIASVIDAEVQRNEFTLRRFYERRIRRILPALSVVCLFSLLAAAILLDPDDFLVFGKSLVALSLFMSNQFFGSFGGDGYFDPGIDRQALLHTWSLSVEEQFYLVFPVALIVLRRFAKVSVTPALLAAIVASFGLSVWMVARNPSAAFYLAPTRAWELLIGAALAIAPVPRITSRAVREALGWAGLGLVLVAIFTFSSQTPFPGLGAVVPCFGAAAMIYAGIDGETTVGRLLSRPAAVFIGLISYSLYLWHWPVIVFFRYYLAEPTMTYLQEFACVAASVGLAVLSYRFVERPFRGKRSRITRRQVFMFAGGVGAISIVSGLAIYQGGGLPQRYDARTRTVVAENVSTRKEPGWPCGNWRSDAKTKDAISYCEFGKGADNVLFVGDSHVQQLIPLFRRLYAGGPYNQGVIFAVSSGCPPAAHMNLRDRRMHCNTFNRLVMARAKDPDIRTVYIGFSTWWSRNDATTCFTADQAACVRTMPRDQAIDYFLRDLGQTIRDLRQSGKRVVVALPFPSYDQSIPDLEIHNAVFGPLMGERAARDTVSEGLRERIRSAVQSQGATIFDARQALCPHGRCTYSAGGVSIYSDWDHLTSGGVDRLEGALTGALGLARTGQVIASTAPAAS